MQLDYSLLKSIHNKLGQITDLNDQKERLPRMVKAAMASESKMLQELEEAKLALIAMRKIADEKQMQLSVREARIEKMTGQRNAAENNREFQVLGDQIQADKDANAVLSDEILEALVNVDDLVQKVATAKSNHAKGVAETARVQADAANRESRVKDDLARVTGELKALEKRLPPDIIEEYTRLVRAASENALAETDGETCGSCYSVITTQTLSDLYAKKAVFCKNCGTLLYHLSGKLV